MIDWLTMFQLIYRRTTSSPVCVCVCVCVSGCFYGLTLLVARCVCLCVCLGVCFYTGACLSRLYVPVSTLVPFIQLVVPSECVLFPSFTHHVQFLLTLFRRMELSYNQYESPTSTFTWHVLLRSAQWPAAALVWRCLCQQLKPETHSSC